MPQLDDFSKDDFGYMNDADFDDDDDDDDEVKEEKEKAMEDNAKVCL